MKRGEIRWYTFKAPDKRRPVLVLTRNSALRVLSGVVVAPLTTTIRQARSQVLLTPDDDGVPQPCVVNLDNLQTVQKSQLQGLVAVLTAERIKEVDESLCFALEVDWALQP